ncbi:MAG: hypothetical protein L0Z62_18525 [Gemmataceae bacterium]|nr:hypothetical protein [Gemmataceae bacterium]
MHWRLVSWAVLVAVLAGSSLVPGWADDSPRSTDAKTPAAAREESVKPSGGTGNGTGAARGSAEKKAAAASVLSQLSNGAIVVLCEDIPETLRLLPKAVVLTPEKYQELLEQLEQLKRQTKTAPDIPSICNLTGHVEGDLVRLQAEFAFFTDRPKALVTLGCQSGWATDATTEDGKLPWLQYGDSGYLVQMDKPGSHRVTLHLVVPLVTKGERGTDRGFDLDLPRAAITNLKQLHLPSSVSTVRVGGRSGRQEKTKRLDPSQSSRLEDVALGAVSRLDLAWKGPVPLPLKSAPLLAAEGQRISVRVEETHVATEAVLNLYVLSGETSQWRILISPNATLEKPQLQDERIQSVELPTPENPVLTLRLKEASAEPLPLTLQFTQPRKGAGWLPALPCTVLDAYPQRGKIEIHARPDLHLHYQRHGDIIQQEVPEDQRRESNTVAIFNYWNLKAPADPTQPPPTPLALDVEPIQGSIETRVLHTLRLTEQGWRVTTRIECTPHRTAVDRLEVYFPVAYQFDRDEGVGPADLVDPEVVIHPETRVAQLKLAQRPLRQFHVTLAGLYPVQAGQREASLELPYPKRVGPGEAESGRVPDPGALPLPPTPRLLDRGAQVTVVVPEGLEVVARQARAEAPGAGPRESYTWQTERVQARADLVWRPHRSELTVDSVVDVTLTEHQARVIQRLRWAPPPAQVQLRVPSTAAHVRLQEGGKLESMEKRRPGTGSSWVVSLTPEPRPPLAGKEHFLTLVYSITLPERGSRSRRFTMPFVQPEPATRGETKVRVWSDPGVQPSLVATGSWEELPTEVVPNRDSLPALVLRGGLDQRLALSVTEGAPLPLAAAVIERILARVRLTEDGQQIYRVRFLLTKLNTRHLELELPAPLANLKLDVLLGGRQVPLQEANPRDGTSGGVRLLIEPELYRKPVLLDLTYQIDPNRTANPETLQATLRPPVLRGAVLLGRARWQVELLPGWIPLYPGGGALLEQRWAWWHGLWAPRPVVTSADLEHWLTGSDAAAATEEGEPSLVCWQTTLEPLRLFCVPLRAWLLVCSCSFLALGLLLCLAPLARSLFWSSVLGISLAVALAGILWPGGLPPILYGCEPGGLVLLAVLAIQWTLQQRYRRQVVFMPGFTRLKPGSSLIRGSSNNRPREPSTVDEPPRRGSSSSSELKP